MTKTYDVIVLGLGAAGLFAMANLDSKLNVLGIERNNKVGIKLSITGNGRCNLTNQDDVKTLVASYTDSAFVRPIIYGFNNQKTVEYFKANGLAVVAENGRIYPQSQRAKDVVAFFVKKIAEKGHNYRLDETIIDINCTGKTIQLIAQNNSYHCKHLIIATGGATYPQTGSDGALVKKCFDISQYEAALSPIYIKETTFHNLSGVSLDAAIKYGKLKFTGSLLFAGGMLTGAPIMDLSNYIKLNDSFIIDFVPQLSHDAIKENIKRQTKQNPKKLIKTILIAVLPLPESFIKALVKQLNLEATTMANLSTKQLNQLIENLKNMTLTAKDKAPLKKAIVSKGGIKTKNIDNKTMCLKEDMRISVIGEAIELVGACGGYSLQFAFSSAYRAVQHLNCTV